MGFDVVFSVTKKDIKQMIKLDKKAYLGSELVDLNRCLEWLKKCPEIYTCLKYNKKIVGYINFMPVTKNSYDKMKSGKKKDFEFEIDDICHFEAGENYCLFTSVVIDSKLRFTNAMTFLFLGFKSKLIKLKEKGVIIKNIICDCLTKEGEALAKHFNGRLVAKTNTGSKIYEFDNIYENLKIK